MALFYVEKGSNQAGDHLIHSSTCSCLPEEAAMHYVGSYAQAPVKEVLDRYVRVSTCPECLPA